MSLSERDVTEATSPDLPGSNVDRQARFWYPSQECVATLTEAGVSANQKNDKGWLGALAALALAWNGCGYVSETASVYEKAEYITMYDSQGKEHFLEAEAGWHPRPNKNRNVPLGMVMILGAVAVGFWSMEQFG